MDVGIKDCRFDISGQKLCGYLSRSRSHYLDHIIKHFPPCFKPLQCQDCDEVFRNRQGMARHANRDHPGNAAYIVLPLSPISMASTGKPEHANISETTLASTDHHDCLLDKSLGKTYKFFIRYAHAVGINLTEEFWKQFADPTQRIHTRVANANRLIESTFPDLGQMLACQENALITVVPAIFPHSELERVISRQIRKKGSAQAKGRDLLKLFWRELTARVCNQNHAQLVHISSRKHREAWIFGLEITINKEGGLYSPATYEMQIVEYLAFFRNFQSIVVHVGQLVGIPFIGFSFEYPSIEDEDVGLYVAFDIGSMILGEYSYCDVVPKDWADVKSVGFLL